ncbi:hypothetical protein BGX34_005147 [Mortierella sp. NVP85]|nr:hypothetical protein BGX34_005147 [Mortierella sp. NVP85]
MAAPPDQQQYYPPTGEPNPYQVQGTPQTTTTYQYVQPGAPVQYTQQPPQGAPYQQYVPPGTPMIQQGSPLVQAPGTPMIQQGSPVYAQQQYVQHPPGTIVPSPELKQPTMLEGAFVPGSPVVPQQQQYVYAASPIAPAVVVQETSQPVVTGGDGKGIIGKMPQLNECCFCLPLHTGALIIAGVMVIYYGYCGLVLVTFSSYSSAFIIFLIIGILYLIIALVSAYGFAGILKQNVELVDRFVKMFIGCFILWALLYIVKIIIYASYGLFVPWAGFIVELIISGVCQYYFTVCLVSYQRVLHARVDSWKGEGAVEMS